jgi:fructoselysine-6-P-deglycase FrlB-like protein
MSTPQWHESWFPELRGERPWLMEEMIDAEPSAAERIASNRKLAEAAERIAAKAAAAHAAGEAITVVGCGTSEHGARAIAELLDEALGHRGVRVLGRESLEASVDPAPGGLTIGVSHEGGTRAASDKGAAREGADSTLVTPVMDRSWCHTVAYLSAITAGAVIAGAITGKGIDAKALRVHLDECRALRPQAIEMAQRLRGIERLIVVGGGYDRITADELVLKVEEGTHIPSAARSLETFLHGHLPACDERTGLVVIATEHRGRARRSDRGRLLLRSARRVGMPCAAILVPAVESVWGRELTNAGRILLPHAPHLTPTTSALAASALALQLLTLELAHDLGTYPDLIRREEEPWREAAAIAEGAEEW